MPSNIILTVRCHNLSYLVLAFVACVTMDTSLVLINLTLFGVLQKPLIHVSASASQVLSSNIQAYIHALVKLQLDIATAADLIGVDTRSTSLFLRGEPLKNRSTVFALGDRINILKVWIRCSYFK